MKLLKNHRKIIFIRYQYKHVFYWNFPIAIMMYINDSDIYIITFSGNYFVIPL
jgi:hypothetical protein